MKVLILGHNGMLGHMVMKYFKKNNIEVITTSNRWPSNEFKMDVINFDGDYIINCIGAIHQRTKTFDVNWELPIFLDFYSKNKIVHPGTDCEMDDDDYGISKKIARDFIVNTSKNTKSIKTSIIGPELNTKSSLLEWFLSNEDSTTVFGYSKFYWDGNTTLTWAKECLNLITNWDEYDKETIISSECISKKEILDSINQVYERKIIVNENTDVIKNKCLCGERKTKHIKEQLIELINESN